MLACILKYTNTSIFKKWRFDDKGGINVAQLSRYTSCISIVSSRRVNLNLSLRSIHKSTGQSEFIIDQNTSRQVNLNYLKHNKDKLDQISQSTSTSTLEQVQNRWVTFTILAHRLSLLHRIL